MATLFLSSSPNLAFLFFQPHHRLTLRRPPPLDVAAAVRASSSSSVKNSRRKTKSNEELCRELMEFVAAVGLPQGHIPSMKELSHHGRKDLAYIVRRRGYKLIGQLLGESAESESVDGNDVMTGQGKEVNDVVEEVTSFSEVSVLEINYETLVTDRVLKHEDEGVDVPAESSVDLLTQNMRSSNLKGQVVEKADNMEDNGHVPNRFEFDKVFNSKNESCVPKEISSNSPLGMTKELSLPTIVPVGENSSGGSNIASDDYHIQELSLPFESDTNWSSDRGEEVSLLTKASTMEEEDHSSSDLESHNTSEAPVQPPADFSLEEKVKSFVENGDLDMFEENIYGVSIESDAKEIKSSKQFGYAEQVELQTPTSVQGTDTTDEDAPSSADSWSSLPDNNLDVRRSEKEEEENISCLKSMLHQKELELSRLKEQIEKEQNALSVLQANAETEISKAQKLILEKDAELLAAEENLSGLVEVEIQYQGEGEIVEVTGSFNGWHLSIKLDPQPRSSIVDHVGSRLWSTMLWLYPGIYEIKFLIDGHWNIDPQRETVTRGTICNNILRVDG